MARFQEKVGLMLSYPDHYLDIFPLIMFKFMFSMWTLVVSKPKHISVDLEANILSLLVLELLKELVEVAWTFMELQMTWLKPSAHNTSCCQRYMRRTCRTWETLMPATDLLWYERTDVICVIYIWEMPSLFFFKAKRVKASTVSLEHLQCNGLSE